ncbi:CsgG/HfaB family protein [Aureimonas psammosilenae]|uniref:CsgG/HfaB family protein n=1 Tax=Aureimonas psammosilenae TaxID=2495496 RepID=UPI001261223B|nr:CsgG/HfaB family protein [Aureimonas psammosilenae]
MASRLRCRTLAARGFIAGLSLLTLGGCVTEESRIDTRPVVAKVSRPNDDLRRVPPPEKRTVLAVYDIEDLTGQFKERENVQSLSRAVTQGGAAILIKALQDAGERRWFTVLERKELDNLLRERQILTEMRRIYNQETQIDASALPPLLHAGIIIEGGIIGYDSNIVTGGLGARFLGIGGDTKYSRDVVTVTLRAISTKTGEVLTSVTTRKAVASYSLQGGAFRYVKLTDILEAEAGTTYNEPKQIAVQSAMEMAVLSLIVEGAELGLWNFADHAAGAAYIDAYKAQTYGDKITPGADDLPRPLTRDPASITETIATGPRPVTVRRIMPGEVGSGSGNGLPRAVTRPAGQSGVRQVPGVGFVPNGTDTAPVPRAPQSNAPPALPPAPRQDEPALGKLDEKSIDRQMAALTGFPS